MDGLDSLLDSLHAADRTLPWLVTLAAEPLLMLLELNPSLNISSLAPPANPILLQTDQYYHKRGLCPTADSVKPTKKSNTGAIVGAVVGCIGGIAILVALVFWWRRRKRQQQLKQSTHPEMNQNNNNNGIGPAYNVPPPVPFVTPPAAEGPNGFMHPELGRAPSSYATSTTAYHPSNYGGEGNKDGTQYYNYAPPPPEHQQPTNYLYAHGEQPRPVSGYGSNGPPSLHPSSTPSPPPPSMTPMPGYAPWAIPMSSEGAGGSSITGSSSNPGSPPPLPPPGTFGEGHPNEKAHFMASGNDKTHFSGYAPPPMSSLPEKAGFQPPRMAAQTPAPAYSAAYAPQ